MKTALLLFCLLASTVAETLQNYMLTRHNNDRKRHQVKPLSIDNSLVKKARVCCDNNAKRNQVAHDCKEADGLGENLARFRNNLGPPSEETASLRAYNGWYGEEVDYDYGKGASKNSNAVGHFTQQMWKDTKNMGCARSTNQDKNSTFICCLYSPRGNILGQFVQNVLSPR